MLRKKPAFRWIHNVMKQLNTEIACIKLGRVNVITVSSPELSIEFLKKHDSVIASRPDVSSARLVSNGYLSPSLSPSEEADHLVRFVYNQCINPHKSEVVNVRDVTRHYCGNVIRKTVFSESKNIVMGGYFIPKGSHVVLSRPGLGRNPRIWDEPLRFKPERHIVDEVSNVSLVDHDLRILSFSTGRQGCPALDLGSTTTTMLLARLIQGFSWKQPLDTSTIDLAESKHDLLLAKPLIAHAVPRTPFHFISNEMQLYIHMFTSLMEGLVFGEADSTTIVTGNNHDFLVYPKIREDSSTKNSPS
ncbi:hypothetical protein SASPL_141552 [Salvia splendens]|uniref:Tryptophan N-monooxygenase n=1 Tax=Salvia splendens TaxID=180675 RepID=A0A8X8ZDJ4_SALSN|nr:hypothetical protein SASPL_141552 [Salvia splendens]